MSAQGAPFKPSEILEVQNFVSDQILPVRGFLADTERATNAKAFFQIPFHNELVNTLIDDYYRLEHHLPHAEVFVPTLHALENLREHLITLEERGPDAGAAKHPDFVRTRSGRYRYDVPDDALTAYVEEGFTNGDIAELLGVSKSWVKRARRRLGLTRSAGRTVITDEELMDVIMELKENGGAYMGEVGMESALKDEGISVPRQRLRDAIAAVDHEGILG